MFSHGTKDNTICLVVEKVSNKVKKELNEETDLLISNNQIY